MKGKNIKEYLPMLIMAVALVILTIGATYAYFVVTANNETKTVSGTLTIESVGSPLISSTGNNLTLDLTNEQMQAQGSDVTYYASATGATTVETSETIGEIKVSGNGTFNCTFSLTASASATNSLYEAFQAMSTKSTGQIILTIDGQEYDFNTTSLFPITYSGSATVSASSGYDIKAGLKLVNLNSVDQTDLNNTDITIKFNLESFDCAIAS